MGMADSAKTGENARWRSRTARAHPIFDICDLILRSNFLKFQILSPLLPLNLWLNFENLTHCPFKSLNNHSKNLIILKKNKFAELHAQNFATLLSS